MQFLIEKQRRLRTKKDCYLSFHGGIYTWMQELDDVALLREYFERDSAEAFEALVARHINKVYSVALRHTGNPHQAEEITQAVFVILARKSHSLGKRVVLSGWLYQTARLTAVTFLRSEIRRARREQEAHMQTMLNEGESNVWTQIAPLLDAAMGGLNETNRHAIVLRFFDGKSMKEVGTALGASEDAAKMRVNRALGKLQKFFLKRGVASSAEALAEAVAANSVQAASVVLAESVTAVALMKGAATGHSILTLVQKTMQTMTWFKLKFTVGVSVVLLLAVGSAAIAFSETGKADHLTPRQIVEKTLEKYASLKSFSDTGRFIFVRNDRTNMMTTFNIRLARTNLYRIEWEQNSPPAVPTKAAVWSAGDGNFILLGESKYGTPVQYKKVQDMHDALVYASMAGWGAAIAFFDLNSNLKVLALGGGFNVERRKDQKIGGVDCYVITWTGTENNLTQTVWIGKRDFLLHQIRTIVKPPLPMPANRLALDAEFEREAKQILAQTHQAATPEAIAAKQKELWQAMEKSNQSTNISTETHEKIAVNQPFTESDFRYHVPTGLKLETAN